MTSDTAPPTNGLKSHPLTLSLVDDASQVSLKQAAEQVLLCLPKLPTVAVGNDWHEIWQQLKHRLSASERFWQSGTSVRLLARDRLLDGRQLQAIADALSEYELQLRRVETSRRQTAVAAATAGYSVEQQSSVSPILVSNTEPSPRWSDPLYLQTTVRSGVEIRHSGTISIVGDINPGGTVIAAGDIVIWGRLRGVAHAGAAGDRQCRIMALRMEPTQLRIAGAVARAPETPPEQMADPEVAYITSEGIRIARGIDFAKTHTFSAKTGVWTET